jgi:hypothetical protein
VKARISIQMISFDKAALSSPYCRISVDKPSWWVFATQEFHRVPYSDRMSIAAREFMLSGASLTEAWLSRRHHDLVIPVT